MSDFRAYFRTLERMSDAELLAELRAQREKSELSGLRLKGRVRWSEIPDWLAVKCIRGASGWTEVDRRLANDFGLKIERPSDVRGVRVRVDLKRQRIDSRASRGMVPIL